jgi:type I restriction enzyme M protein
MADLKATLWKAADKLRGSLSASQYKDVILGLVFLKYVSDAYDERRELIRSDLAGQGYDDEQIDTLIDDPEEYQGYGVFLVPPQARWRFLAENAKGMPAQGMTPAQSVGALVDAAMDTVMGANPTLRGTLPKIYNRENIDQRRLGELLDLFNDTRFSRQGEHRARDLMGEVYEYFLGAFARAEGKRGGEFFTPPSVVKTLVEVLQPDHGRVYDPCCGSGGMFVQAEKFIAAHHGDPTGIAVYGQEAMEKTWRLAKMNLAIHGIENTGLGTAWHDTFARDVHPEMQMDFILANPPFNIKDWVRNTEDPRWRFGVPPATNANFAWIQHILSKLAPGGRAGVVMANGSMSSNTGGEGDIRAAIVRADQVACMVALPTQLFRSTGIPVCLWFFAKHKEAGAQGAIDRKGQVLFIDARDLGYMVDRAERDLAPEDIARIADTFHIWRGTPGAMGTYEDVPGFCKSATLAEIKANGYVLTPGRYVGSAEVPDDGEPLDDKIARLTSEVRDGFALRANLQQRVLAALDSLEVNHE